MRSLLMPLPATTLSSTFINLSPGIMPALSAGAVFHHGGDVYRVADDAVFDANAEETALQIFVYRGYFVGGNIDGVRVQVGKDALDSVGVKHIAVDAIHVFFVDEVQNAFYAVVALKRWW